MPLEHVPFDAQITKGYRWQGVSFREMFKGSPTESISVDRAQATQKLACNWEDRVEFVQYVLGWSEAVRNDAGSDFPVDGPTGRWLHRQVPMPYAPYRTDKNIGRFYMHADSVNITGDDVKQGEVRQYGYPGGEQALKGNTFAEAYADVGFSARNFVIMDDDEMKQRQADATIWPHISSARPDEATLLRYVSATVRPRAHFQSLPSFKTLKWNDTAAPHDYVAEKLGYIIQEADVEITWHQVPIEAYPKTAIASALGKTNFLPFGAREGPLKNFLGEFPAGTLICSAPTVKQHRMSNGDWACDITYKFTYHPNGANTFLHVLGVVNNPGAANNGQPWIRWENVSRDGDAYIDINYTIADFMAGVNGGSAVYGNSDALLFQPANFFDLFRPEDG